MFLRIYLALTSAIDCAAIAYAVTLTNRFRTTETARYQSFLLPLVAFCLLNTMHYIELGPATTTQLPMLAVGIIYCVGAQCLAAHVYTSRMSLRIALHQIY